MTDLSSLANLRQRLDLPLTRRATGLLEGRHRSLLQGHGEEFDDLSLYAPGDDVGDIDWKASARSGLPVIKRFETQRNVSVVLAVDTGRSMTATAAGGEPKSEVARLVVALVAYVARNRGDRVGLVAADAGRLLHMPARGGSGHLEVALRRVDRSFDPDAPASDLLRLLRRAEVGARRGLVVLVTDDGAPAPEHEQALRRLRARHELMVVSVADVDPLAPPPAGLSTRDVVDGWSVPTELQGRDDLRAALARHRAEKQAARAGLLRRLGATDVVVGSTDDVVPAMLAAAGRRRGRR